MTLRVSALLAVACAFALALLAGPALSLEAYRPDPVDFELAAPDGARAAGGPVVSRALRAPKRFNLVGMRWRSGAEPEIALRARRSGGRWSRWAPVAAHADHAPDPGRGERTPVGASDPAWVGEADEVQYRMNRGVPGLRLHFVNARGTATPKDRARSAIRRVANSAVLSLAGAVGAREAGAAQRPSIVPRSAWGAEKCPPRSGADYGAVKAAHIHHTVSINDYTEEEAPDIVLSICRFHRNSNGWSDVGYNFLVDKYGVIYEGRAGGVDRAVVGAQAQGYNSQTTGISNIGNHSSVPQSDAALNAIARLLRWKLPLHGVPTTGRATLRSAGGDTSRYGAGANVTVPRVLGHRDTNSTECPGGALYAQLEDLRRRVGEVAPQGRGTALSTRVSPRTVLHGRTATASGRLTLVDGTPLANLPIEVQSLRGRSWRRAASAVTDGDGRFTVAVKPGATRYLRTRFAGQGDLRAASSVRTLMSVRPAFRLPAPPARAAKGVKVPVVGTVSPGKGRVYMVLLQRRRGRNVTLGVKKVRVRQRRFRTSFKPASTGTYRFYFTATADRYSTAATSRRYTVRVSRFGGGAVAPR